MKTLTLPLLLALALPAGAQDGLRDPTLAPAAARPAAPPASGAETASAGNLPQHIMVLNGRPYLIVAGHRLGVGDALGEARITRIGDGAVWLREGGVTRRVSLYAGVEKRPVPVEGATPKAPSKAHAKVRPDMATPKNNKEQP
nr:hypothetical protein [uncultured Roseateles sp.]